MEKISEYLLLIAGISFVLTVSTMIIGFPLPLFFSDIPLKIKISEVVQTIAMVFSFISIGCIVAIVVISVSELIYKKFPRNKTI